MVYEEQDEIVGSGGFFSHDFGLGVQAETVVCQRGESNQFVQDYSGVIDAAIVDSRGVNLNYGGRNTTFVGVDKAGQINRPCVRSLSWSTR